MLMDLMRARERKESKMTLRFLMLATNKGDPEGRADLGDWGEGLALDLLNWRSLLNTEVELSRRQLDVKI